MNMVSPPDAKNVKKRAKQATEEKMAQLKRMKTKTKSISKKWTDELPVFARIHAENSKVRTPQLMMYATSGHPGPKGWPQSFRSFKTMEDLTNPENDFFQVAKLMVLLEEDFADVALLNQTAKVVCATERKLLKALNN
jgi:hypothetical protein